MIGFIFTGYIQLLAHHVAPTTQLLDKARTCLNDATSEAKVASTFVAAQAFQRGELDVGDDGVAPDPIHMPGRPPKPTLVHPRDLPRRGFGTQTGRAAFVHSIAHIEFNAIDLAWDAVYRFRGLPPAFYADWVGVANDEARHFAMLRRSEERRVGRGWRARRGR